jgi:hypothetical protein
VIILPILRALGRRARKKAKESARLVVVLFFGVLGWVRGCDRVYF